MARYTSAQWLKTILARIRLNRFRSEGLLQNLPPSAREGNCKARGFSTRENYPGAQACRLHGDPDGVRDDLQRLRDLAHRGSHQPYLRGRVSADSRRREVGFDAVDSAMPAIKVDYRNFSQIAARDAHMEVNAVVDGKAVMPPEGTTAAVEAGILSPSVPHFFYAYIRPEIYQAVAAGTSKLQVQVKMNYRGPARATEYCYLERMVYDFRARVFNSAGGSDRCGSDKD